MDEQGLQNLLALGFTYEDLYKRGLLVLKSAEQKPEQKREPEQKKDPEQKQEPEQKKDPEQKQEPEQKKDPEQKQEPEQKQDAAAALTAVLESFKDDLIKAIQKTNMRDATRDKNEKLSLDDAIAGLMKGDSSNG